MHDLAADSFETHDFTDDTAYPTPRAEMRNGFESEWFPVY